MRKSKKNFKNPIKRPSDVTDSATESAWTAQKYATSRDKTTQNSKPVKSNSDMDSASYNNGLNEAAAAPSTQDVAVDIAQLLQWCEKNRQRRHKERLDLYEMYQEKLLAQRESANKMQQQLMERLVQRLLET